MNIKKKVKDNQTELTAITLLLGGSVGPVQDLMNTFGLDWDQIIPLIMSTNFETLILWAVIAALYFRKEPKMAEVDKEQLRQLIMEELRDD